ncbi:hypothetical protein ACFPMF_23860 [Larkinella bovis]|uniref:Uncharacterized protein n=1 Tax=Larkinella bovis TaxID=683041 RepID=A0ABW0IIZ9_9BACT
MTYLPTSHRLTYRLDIDRGRYIVKECEPGFCKVPRELIVEERRFNDNIDAEFILRGPDTKKKEPGTGKRSARKITFFTGLQRTNYAGVYIGNVVTFGQGGSKVRNGVIVQFSTDAGRMTLRYFPAYYPFPKDRAAFVASIVGRGLL